MANLSPARRLLKLLHPEAIPWPGTIVYNALTASSIFQRNYDLVAQDVVNYRAEGSLLDVGTGPGWLLLSLHRQSPRMQLTGMDASPSMVARARQNIDSAGLSNEIQVEEGNVSEMHFADASFDTVVSTGSLHHWKDPVAGLNEIHRVLKPAGYALLYDIVSDTPASIMQELAREFGRLKTLLLWIHAFEEPFYSHANFASLARPSLFKQGETRFVGVQCCLILQKCAGNAQAVD